jgi:hypothetical protein
MDPVVSQLISIRSARRSRVTIAHRRPEEDRLSLRRNRSMQGKGGAMPSPVRRQRTFASGWDAWILSAIAAAVYYPLAVFGPGWWQGARLSDMDPPFDLGWLHNLFAWTAGSVGQALLWVFGGMILLLPIMAIFTNRFSAGPPAVKRVVASAWTVPCAALVAVPALAIGWFALTQIAYLIAPFVGMYHGDVTPAVP